VRYTNPPTPENSSIIKLDRFYLMLSHIELMPDFVLILKHFQVWLSTITIDPIMKKILASLIFSVDGIKNIEPNVYSVSASNDSRRFNLISDCFLLMNDWEHAGPLWLHSIKSATMNDNEPTTYSQPVRLLQFITRTNAGKSIIDANTKVNPLIKQMIPCMTRHRKSLLSVEEVDFNGVIV
jgi:hypothetical protein